MTPETARTPRKEGASVFVSTTFEPALSLDDVAEFSGIQGLEEQVSDKHYVRQLLITLTPREERVVRLRFGLGDYPPASFKSIGEEMGLTAGRVQQIEQKALRKMKIRAVRTALRLPRSEIDRLCGVAKPQQATTATRPLHPNLQNRAAETQRVVPTSLPPRQRPPRQSRPCPQREPQFREAQRQLRPWPHHIALLAAYCAPFALIDLLFVSDAVRTSLAATIGPLPTAVLELVACGLIPIPLVLLLGFGSRDRGA